jgi:TetR/AcrR family transcriptional regulator, transcriptional repressor for nem operon
MRYRPEHKAEIHRKIVKDAARRLRAEGLRGAAVAEVMRDNGLTHGGFYKHFASKDALLVESLREAFRDMAEKLEHAARAPHGEAPWKAIVRTYLSLEFCDRAERGCPLTALAPELARVDRGMRGRVLAELVSYKNRMAPFMPGRGAADKERAFFAIFSAMIGAVEIARMLPEAAMREKVLGAARGLLLRSY